MGCTVVFFIDNKPLAQCCKQ